MPCPNCGTSMRAGLFLCMACASTVGDDVVTDIAGLVDDGATAQEAFQEVTETPTSSTDG